MNYSNETTELMMSYKTIIYFAGGFLYLLLCCTACTYDNTSPPFEEPSTYTYNHASTTLKWTAYKYTTMVGVSGHFNEINVSNCITADTPNRAIENMNFNINTQTIDTESSIRDTNILDYFFRHLMTAENISGKVNRCIGDIRSGNIYMDLTMNGIQREIPLDYRMDGTLMHLEGNFSLSDFEADAALDSMIYCCAELHTGSDGIHLLWPDIQIEITTDFGN